MNVSNEGDVPVTRETVVIQFTCSGSQNAQVVVDFNFEFVTSDFLENVTQITFKREKHCVKGMYQRITRF